MPVTFWLMLIATLAIAGIPPFSGFFSKDEILAGAFARGAEQPIYYVFYAHGRGGGAAHRLLHGAPDGDDVPGRESHRRRERTHLHDAPLVMTGPLLVLGVLSLVGGAAQPAALRRRRRGPRALAGAGRSPPAQQFFGLEMPARPTELSPRRRRGGDRDPGSRGRLPRDAAAADRAGERGAARTAALPA